jgi:hypothetical protein
MTPGRAHPEHNWEAAIRKLVALTTSDSITWREAEDVSRPDVVGKVYVAGALNRRIAVYERRRKTWNTPTTWYWQPEPVVELVDEHGTLEWKWPKCEAATELLEAVRYQHSRAEAFLLTWLQDGREKGAE